MSRYHEVENAIPRLLGTRWVARAERVKTRIILIVTYIFML